MALAQINLDAAVEKYFDKIKNNPQKLETFLFKMPKGGDLHNHHGGASMAENMISYAKGDDLCVDQKTLRVDVNPQCPANDSLDHSSEHPELYNAMIDAWSMRHFSTKNESGHDHFFATFRKYGVITSKHSGEMLAEIVQRAGMQNEIYLELMMTPDNNASGLLGKKMGWDPDLEKFRDQLLNNGLAPIIAGMSKKIDADEVIVNHTLRCKTAQAKAGCHVKLRYLYQALREQPPEQIFAQLLAGFEIASKDPRVVGINLVQAEDGKISMKDYSLQMRMIHFLHGLYPHVHVSLHAGELIPGLVPPEGLRFHIHDAVDIAQAERIGHGVDMAYEDHADQLLKEMAKKHVLVEINLSSNAAILNVSGQNHPVLLYLRNGVPVALSTDDEGVLRTSLTEEYIKATLNYHFSYSTIKNLVRNSIYYSFLPGDNLWVDDHYCQKTLPCRNDSFNADFISPACQGFLASSEKAQLQWKLEQQFLKFEADTMYKA